MDCSVLPSSSLVTLSSLLLLLTAYLHPSPHWTSHILLARGVGQTEHRWGKVVPISSMFCKWMSSCGLAVVFILGLAVLVMVLVVVVIVPLVEGNRTHKFAGLFALGWANLLTSSFLTLDFAFCVFFLWTMWKSWFFFFKWIWGLDGTGFSHPFCPPHMLLFSSARMGTVLSVYSRGCRLPFQQCGLF